MDSGFRTLAVIGIIIALVAGGALFLINRTRTQQAQVTPTPGPLEGTPSPTFLPFGTTTPFPLLILPTTSPTGSPRATATSTPRVTATPTGTPAPQLSCLYLTAQPADGTAPLSVRFTASGFGAIVSTIAEYEFTFGDASAAVRQSGSTSTHTYTTAGNFVANLRIRDNSGNVIALPGGECRRSINVRAVPTVDGSPKPAGQLPKTGPEEWLWLAVLPAIGVGIYLYKKYRLI